MSQEPGSLFIKVLDTLPPNFMKSRKQQDMGFELQSLWNLTGVSAGLLRHLSNFRMICEHPVSRLWSFYSHMKNKPLGSKRNVFVFIRPFEKRDVSCRGNVRPSVRLSVRPSVRPSVCPSVRPRFPDFSSTCFEISIWNLVYTFSRWHDMSSLSCITIGSLWPSLQPKVGQTYFLQSWPHK